MSTGVPDVDDELVGRCYTKARRAPLVHGVVRSVNGGPNFRLPFGPYTGTQLAAIVISVALLVLSRPLWGGHGPADVVVLVAVPAGAAVAMRHLHIDGRNPAAAAASVALMLTSPRWGRFHGRPLRPARPWYDAPRVTLTSPAPGADPAALPVPTPARTEQRTPPSAAAVGPATPAPMASGVQALLARRSGTPTD